MPDGSTYVETSPTHQDIHGVAPRTSNAFGGAACAAVVETCLETKGIFGHLRSTAGWDSSAGAE